jgi:glycosyltransferase involved in cell wall biosynthesis
MTRRRILIASEPMEYGVLSYLERLLDGLDRQRWEPAFAFSPHRMAPQAHRLVARLQHEGVRLCRLRFRRGFGVADAAAAAQLAAEVRAFRPDVLHVHSTKAGVVGRLAARLLGVPVLYTAHGTSWHYTGRLVGRVQLGLERALRRATDALLAVCPEEARAFVAEVGFLPARVRVVRNGVPVPSRAALAAGRDDVRTMLGIPPGETWAVFVGRLTHEKGLDVLLRALESRIAIDGLVVVGDGRDRAALEAEAAATAVPVRFVGYHEDVSGFLAAGDVFVQPSRSEGLPFSLLEAMAHGLPVVCTAVGGMPAAMDGAGRQIQAEDSAALAAALDAMGQDAALRAELGAAGRRRIEREFGVPAMLAALHDAYEEACTPHPRRIPAWAGATS